MSRRRHAWLCGRLVLTFIKLCRVPTIAITVIENGNWLDIAYLFTFVRLLFAR